MKLILEDGNTITYDHDNGIGDIVAQYNTQADAQAVAALITPENTQSIQIQTDGGSPVSQHTGLILDGTEVIPIYGDEEAVGYELHVHLREKTQMEIVTERLDALEESQNLQDGAIDDLGEAVSGLYE